MYKLVSTAMILGVLMAASTASAEPGGPGGGGPYPFPGPGGGQPGKPYERPRLFRASAQHVCWSKEVIGYNCYVQGIGYSDCMQANFALQSQGSCCREHYFQGKRVTDGHSTGLTGFSCSWW